MRSCRDISGPRLQLVRCRSGRTIVTMRIGAWHCKPRMHTAALLIGTKRPHLQRALNDIWCLPIHLGPLALADISTAKPILHSILALLRICGEIVDGCIHCQLFLMHKIVQFLQVIVPHGFLQPSDAFHPNLLGPSTGLDSTEKHSLCSILMACNSLKAHVQ